MNAVLISTLLMLFVGFLGTSIAPAGQANINGKYKEFSTFVWTMLNVLVKIGAPALTARVPIFGVIIFGMFFLSAVVSSIISPQLLKFTSC